MVPEPLTIFTTSVSILNLVRNGFATIYTDIEDYRSYPEYYALLGKKLKVLRESMENWQVRWMIWSADNELFRYLWATGYQEVITHLGDIEKQWTKLDKMLNECDIKGRGIAKRIGKRFINTLTKKLDHVGRKITRIEDLMKALTSSADTAFCRVQNRRDRSDDSPLLTKEIHKLGYKNLLVRLAWNTFKASDELHGNCDRARAVLTMHMELNFFGTDIKEKDRLLPGIEASQDQNSERSASMFEAVAKSAVDLADPAVTPEKSAKDAALRYTFLSKTTQGGQLWVRIRATPAKIQDRGACRMTFSEAQNAVTARTEGRDRCGLELSPNGTLAVVRDEFGDIQGTVPDPVSLRTILRTAPAPDVDRDLLKLLRLRRAFQVVEFGMLFLKTSWIHCICSCNISQVMININPNETSYPEDSYRYTLKIPPVGHAPVGQEASPSDDDSDHGVDGPGAQHDSMTSCWCIHKLPKSSAFQTYPLFYVGLLLVEVALDALIVKVEIERGGIVRPEVLKLTYTNVHAGVNNPIERTLESLEAELGKDYYDVTVTCLENTWTSQSVQQDELGKYFLKVLYPIFTLYNDLALQNRQTSA